jgi:hypothetical protein
MRTITNVKLFKDRACTIQYNELYELEIVGKKLRVRNPNKVWSFDKDKSRLNFYHWLGQGSNCHFYTTLVNGYRVYIRLTNKL